MAEFLSPDHALDDDDIVLRALRCNPVLAEVYTSMMDCCDSVRAVRVWGRNTHPCADPLASNLERVGSDEKKSRSIILLV